MKICAIKSCNDNLAPQAPEQELSASERRALKRQLDSFIGDLARGLLGQKQPNGAPEGNLDR